METLKQKEERVSWLAASSLILESVNEMRSCPASDLHVALDLLPRLCPERANLTPFASFLPEQLTDMYFALLNSAESACFDSMRLVRISCCAKTLVRSERVAIPIDRHTFVPENGAGMYPGRDVTGNFIRYTFL